MSNAWLQIRSMTSTISKPERWLIDMFGGYASKSGARVNQDTAMKIIAVYACIRLISETIASIRPKLMRRLKRGKEEATDEALYHLLYYLPNKEMTAFEFWQVMMLYALLYKNGGLAEVVRNEAGDPVELWPIPPWCWTQDRNPKTDELMYRVNAPDKKQYILYPENIFHIKGFTINGVESFDPVGLFKEAAGLSLAAEEYASRYFSNGTNAGGIVEYPGKMTDEAFKRYKDSLREEYTGLGQSNRLIFLEQGGKFTKISTPPNESQFIETRQHQVVEIARFFNVQPDMIMDFLRATFSNIEHASLRYIMFTIDPWAEKIELAIYKDLITPQKRKKLYAKFNFNKLLRADFKTRTEGYHYMIQDGVYSPNDVLDMEDRNPIDGPEGDRHYINSTMVPLEMAGMNLKNTLDKGGGSK
jgi:HK97 family phage portal protein